MLRMINKIKTTIKTFTSEYKQVKWPSLQTTINLTIFVLVVSAIITLIIIGMDGFFFDLRSRFILN